MGLEICEDVVYPMGIKFACGTQTYVMTGWWGKRLTNPAFPRFSG